MSVRYYILIYEINVKFKELNFFILFKYKINILFIYVFFLFYFISVLFAMYSI